MRGKFITFTAGTVAVVGLAALNRRPKSIGCTNNTKEKLKVEARYEVKKVKSWGFKGKFMGNLWSGKAGPEVEITPGVGNGETEDHETRVDLDENHTKSIELHPYHHGDTVDVKVFRIFPEIAEILEMRPGEENPLPDYSDYSIQTKVIDDEVVEFKIFSKNKKLVQKEQIKLGEDKDLLFVAESNLYVRMTYLMGDEATLEIRHCKNEVEEESESMRIGQNMILSLEDDKLVSHVEPCKSWWSRNASRDSLLTTLVPILGLTSVEVSASEVRQK